jgi:hypothetical protein
MRYLAIGFCLFAAACTGVSSRAPTAPSSTLGVGGSNSLLKEVRGGEDLGHLPAALGKGLTDETLSNAGWTCIQPGNGVIICAPPGLGLPSIPPVADGAPTYKLTVFTLDHQFLHRVTLRRPDLYHGQPCVDGEPWVYVAFLNYYECIKPE